MSIPSTAVPGAFENAIPSFAITGFAGIGDSVVDPLNQPDENYQIASGVSKLAGRHALKAGVDFRRTRSARFHGRGTNGTLSFQPGNEGGTGNAWADFLLGLPRQTSIVNIPTVSDLRHAFLLVASDIKNRTFKARVVSLGIRDNVVRLVLNPALESTIPPPLRATIDSVQRRLYDGGIRLVDSAGTILTQ